MDRRTNLFGSPWALAGAFALGALVASLAALAAATPSSGPGGNATAFLPAAAKQGQGGLTKLQRRQVRTLLRKAGLSKRQRRAIGRQVRRLAPNLSVASAATAVSAGLATRADSARLADAATNASKVGGHNAECPGDTKLVGGLCFEASASSASATWYDANAACGAKGRRLGSVAELKAAGEALGNLVGGSGEWSGDVVYNAGVRAVTVEPSNTLNVGFAPTEEFQYRCVTQLVR